MSLGKCLGLDQRGKCMTNKEEREVLLEDKKSAEAIMKYLAPLQNSEAQDIIVQYGETLKAGRLVELANRTEKGLEEIGSSHDRLSGEINGIVLMLRSIDTLVEHAKIVLGESEER